MTTPPEAENIQSGVQRPSWRMITLIAVAVSVVAVLTLLAIEHSVFAVLQEHFVGWIANAGPFGWLVLIGLLILHSFVPFPLEFAAVAAGIVYGFWLGSFLTWVGTILGGALSFWLARRFGRPFLEKMLSETQRNWIDIHSRNEGWLALLVSRLLPFMSFTLVSYAAGFTKVTWWTFLWTSAVGMMPIIMISALYGDLLDQLPLALVIGIPTIAVILLIVLYQVARKRGWIGEAVH